MQPHHDRSELTMGLKEQHRREFLDAPGAAARDAGGGPAGMLVEGRISHVTTFDA